MQERYLGDSHDFLKYGLLRHLQANLDLRLGINWYLTLPEQVDRPGNNDGEKRHHLKGGVWREADPDLFERIHGFDVPAARSLANVAAWGILPAETDYFERPVAAQDRGCWHREGVDALNRADLVFLDPDNGFEVKSMTSRTRPKYALYSEAIDYLAAGKSVVAIQFARQCDPVQRAIEVREKLASFCGEAANLPILRGRVAPNLLFFTLAPAGMTERLAAALREFSTRCAKVELVP
ncbi:hypothetical protein [Altererythrobacter sp. Root672]|uniref:hypothetical protein n=1 Tax=Altererythrobacter sp. Root672 TaxID=1736584 RepID=UPI0006FF039C|nr:hypothetical protein [Altererythrobacter sp. Root672]KRA82542.1 hypothetical protein ASD76_00030 [Altererythrobacter sp. Root672]